MSSFLLVEELSFFLNDKLEPDDLIHVLALVEDSVDSLISDAYNDGLASGERWATSYPPE